MHSLVLSPLRQFTRIFTAADRALDRLLNSTPAFKKQLLKDCATCIETDGVATLEEVQLLRVIAEILGCPMPLVGSLTNIERESD